MKKYAIIIASAIALVFSVWGYISLKKTTVSKEVDVLTALPQTPYSLIRINNIGALSNALLFDNSYWQDVSKLSSFNQLNTAINVLDSIKDTQSAIQLFVSNRTVYMGSFWGENKQSNHLWFAQVSTDEWGMLQPIMKQEMPGGYYFSYENGIFLVGTNPTLLQQAVTQIKSEQSIMANDARFTAMLQTGGKQAAFNWVFNMEMIGDYLLSECTEQGQRMLSDWKWYADWCCFDGIVEGDKLTLNGFAGTQGAFHSTSLMNGQNTGQNTLTDRMPYNTYFFRHTYIDQLDTYLSQLQAYASQHSEDGLITDGMALETPTGETPTLFFRNFFGGEIAYGWSPLGPFVIVKLDEPKRAQERLDYMVEDMGYNAKSSTQGGIKTYKFAEPGFAGCVFGSYYTLPEEHMAIVGNKLIITPQASFTRYIASRKANTQTLQCAPNFKDANRTLLTNANVSMYANIPYMIRNANRFVMGDTYQWLTQTQSLWKNFSTFCLQAENEPSGNSFQHLFIQYNKVMDVDATALLSTSQTNTNAIETEKEGEEPIVAQADSEAEQSTEAAAEEPETAENTEEVEEVEENQPQQRVKRQISAQQPLFTATLDYPAIIAPQAVKNHYTGEGEFAIQDSKNQLYLISASGKILWKKLLQDRILGSIWQVDMLKNNKLQMAFVTEKELVIIDRNGNMLKGYPKALPKQATQGLTVCDYENNKNYRFFIPAENGQIMLLKADGTQPSDWQFAGNKKDIQAPVQYIKQQGKDFILAFDNKQCYFLNRQGKERIHAQNTIEKAKNGVFYADAVGSNQRVVATSPKGDILYIYANEVKTSAVKEFSKNHLFSLFKGNYGNYYLFLDKQGLTVYDRDMNLYMQDASVDAGNEPTLLMQGSKMAVFDNDQDCWIIYNLVSKRKAYQIFKGDTPLAYFGTFKPYASPCLVVADGNTLKGYKVNEK
jgi:hypothetical protein